jgi:hypothetical protein
VSATAMMLVASLAPNSGEPPAARRSKGRKAASKVNLREGVYGAMRSRFKCSDAAGEVAVVTVKVTGRGGGPSLPASCMELLETTADSGPQVAGRRGSSSDGAGRRFRLTLRECPNICREDEAAPACRRNGRSLEGHFLYRAAPLFFSDRLPTDGVQICFDGNAVARESRPRAGAHTVVTDTLEAQDRYRIQARWPASRNTAVQKRDQH